MEKRQLSPLNTGNTLYGSIQFPVFNSDRNHDASAQRPPMLHLCIAFGFSCPTVAHAFYKAHKLQEVFDSACLLPRYEHYFLCKSDCSCLG